MRRALRSARISGQREHRGAITATAEWPGIITPEETTRIRAFLDDPDRRIGQRATVREYLLSGFVVFGACGSRLTARPVFRKGNRYRRYACAADRGGCNRVDIGAEPLEDLIVEAVFRRLDTPKLARAVQAAQRSTGRGSATAIDELAAVEGKLTELAEMWAAGELSRSEWSTARSRLTDKLASARAQVAREERSRGAAALVGQGGQLRAAWPDLSIDQRRAVLAEIVTSVLIATTRANNKFDSSRVDGARRV